MTQRQHFTQALAPARRDFLKRTLTLGLIAGGGYGISRLLLHPEPLQAAETENFEIQHTPEEWRKLLTPQQFYIMREQGTETPFSSPLLHEKRTGVFHCAACDLSLYDSSTKYDSGTGWPSFYAARNEAVGTEEDRSLFMVRTEVHCRRCGGHLGHVFDDGPPPTGKRHCINGVALHFVPA